LVNPNIFCAIRETDLNFDLAAGIDDFFQPVKRRRLLTFSVAIAEENASSVSILTKKIVCFSNRIKSPLIFSCKNIPIEIIFTLFIKFNC
jgi:hypothetical protein